MLRFMTIERLRHGQVKIRVEPYDAITYWLCSERDAIRKYRREFGLQGKHLTKLHL